MTLQDTQTEITELNPREKPPIQALIKEMEETIMNASDYLARIQGNDDVLECYWDGQSPDGRKHMADIGEPAAPWEGASDARLPLADEILAEQKLVMLAALTAGKLNVTPMESGDAPAAALVRPVMGYMLGTVMRQEIWEEINFWADWSLGYGHAVLHICWHVEQETVEKTITAEDLLKFAINLKLDEVARQLDAAGVPQDQVPPQAIDALAAVEETRLRQLLLADERSEMLISQIQEFDAAMTHSEAQRVATALRKGEPGIYYVAREKVSRPKWEALLPFVDVFYPTETRDLQTARWIARLHWLTEVDLIARAEVEGWDEKWVEAVRKRPGHTFQIPDNYDWAFGGAGVRFTVTSEQARLARLYQVVEVFYRGAGKTGVPCLYRTILNGAVRDGYALHEPCGYKHGKMPFIALRRERRRRALTTSRGIPERAQSWQRALKLQHDAREDRTSLATAPPFVVPSNRGGARQEMGPFAQIPEKRAGSFKWLEPPRFDADVVAIQGSIIAQVDRYFGRTGEGVPPAVSMLANQLLVSNFILALSEAVEQTFQLLQQYMEPIKAARVAGMPVPFSATREEIQGRFDMRLTYDVKDLDMEFLKAKFEFLEKVLLMDTEGVVKRADLVQYIFAAVDPVLAQTVVRPAESASQNEVQDEQRNVISMALGFQVPFEMGLNFELRSKVLAEAATQNPHVASRLQVDPGFQERYKERWDFFQHQITQKKNAMIGVLGVDPTKAPVPGGNGKGAENYANTGGMPA
jgi:hypothetical protein